MTFTQKLKAWGLRKPFAQPASTGTDAAPQAEDSPYLNARRAWNDHVGSVMAARATWQLVGLLSLLIALVAVGGAIYLGQQSKFIPYVVEVDKLGGVLAAGPARLAQKAEGRVVQAHLAAWITYAREVTPDVALERKAIFGIYALIGPHDPSAQKMNEYLSETAPTNPFVRAAKETVDIQINSVLQQTPETYQVDWTENTRDRDGVLLHPPVRMRALITVYFVAPTASTTDQKMRLNPLGIYVRDYHWARQL